MFQQQKDSLAALKHEHDIMYTFDLKYEGERYIVCVNRTKSTDENLKIERIMNIDTAENVTANWFTHGIVDELIDVFHEKARKRFEYLRVDEDD